MSGRDKQFPDRGDAGWEIDDGPFVAGPGQDELLLVERRGVTEHCEG